jgi:predicted transcriptional regulator
MPKYVACPLVWGKKEREKMRRVAPVYLEAASVAHAQAGAIQRYKAMGVAVKFVSVSEYDPTKDSELLRMGFVRMIEPKVC